jgi:isopentenyl-diphosphate delta-isomerase
LLSPNTDAEERVVLVDADDHEIGTEAKLRAHETGVLHRAVSVFVFDANRRLLMQRRADGKYHSAGRWSNTCCSHPRPGESPLAAAGRRLMEEMGIECELRPAFSFIYRADLGNGLIEHELDHVFVGTFGGAPRPNANEVQAWGWMALPSLIADCRERPEQYTAWLPLALAELEGRGLP